MTKQELRKKYKDLRNTIKQDQLEDLSIAVDNNLLQLPIWEHSFYHTFLTIEEQKEVNTDYLLNILSGKDKNIVISKSDFTTLEMTHYLLTDNTTLKKSVWNIPEPIDGIEIATDKIDVVFVPLLAFDAKGNRVGYGKGFYDRFLANCKPDTISIGLSFFEAENEIDDVFKDDIPLNYCVTPEKVYKFI